MFWKTMFDLTYGFMEIGFSKMKKKIIIFGTLHSLKNDYLQQLVQWTNIHECLHPKLLFDVYFFNNVWKNFMFSSSISCFSKSRGFLILWIWSNILDRWLHILQKFYPSHLFIVNVGFNTFSLIIHHLFPLFHFKFDLFDLNYKSNKLVVRAFIHFLFPSVLHSFIKPLTTKPWVT